MFLIDLQPCHAPNGAPLLHFGYIGRWGLVFTQTKAQVAPLIHMDGTHLRRHWQHRRELYYECFPTPQACSDSLSEANFSFFPKDYVALGLLQSNLGSLLTYLFQRRSQREGRNLSCARYLSTTLQTIRDAAAERSRIEQSLNRCFHCFLFLFLH